MRRSTPVKKQLLTSQEKDEQIRRQLLFRALAADMMTSRMSYGGTQTYSGLRDIYSALGYPVIDQITFQDYWTRYRRQDIAKRIVEAPVEGSWARSPKIKADDDTQGIFQAVWEELEEKFGIYNALIRADILSGIGPYGILLMGLKDGAQSFADPVDKVSELLYLQPFTSENAKIKTLVADTSDPRFGKPLLYSVRLSGINANSNIESDVHFSRILHFADNCLESSIYGQPRLECVFNNLLDLAKITGGSAEMFWQGAFQGMAFNMMEGYDLTEPDKLLLEDEIKKYVHGMERYMKLKGMEVQQLGPSVSSPKDHADLQIRMISIATKIPKRILEGSERGELSSTQDAEEWDGKCDHRRKHYIEPSILRPFIKRLAELGILKVPEKYSIEWADLSTPSDADQATTGKIRTEAITKYAATPDAQLLVPPEQYFSDILQLPDEVVERIVAAGEEAQAKAMEEEAEEEQKRQADIAELGYDPNDLNDPNNPQNPKNNKPIVAN